MRGLKNFLFGGAGEGAPAVADDVRRRLEAWRQLPRPGLEQPHFRTRYVTVDVTTAGLDSGRDAVLGVAGLGLGPGAVIVPDDAFALDLAAAGEGDAAALDRALLAFLEFAGRGPWVTYQAPFVGGFLDRLLQQRLGLRLEPDWIDLAWVLPDLFKDRIDSVVSLDAWLDVFGIDVPGRHDALADALALARLLQIVLPRAAERGADTPAKLIGIGQARRHLRPGG